jgi:hypothetical protein
MDILINRWKIVAGLGTGIEPFTNQLPNNPLTYGSAIDRWIREMPEAARTRIAFDSYVLKDAQTHANWYDHWTDNLTCAVNALTHGEYVVTDTSIESTMTELKKVGCDSFIIFGGETPIGTGPMFGTQSLVDANGNATSWASAVMRGATASQK